MSHYEVTVEKPDLYMGLLTIKELMKPTQQK